MSHRRPADRPGDAEPDPKDAARGHETVTVQGAHESLRIGDALDALDQIVRDILTEGDLRGAQQLGKSIGWTEANLDAHGTNLARAPGACVRSHSIMAATTCGPSGSFSVSWRRSGRTRRSTPGIAANGSLTGVGTRVSDPPWMTSVGMWSRPSPARPRFIALKSSAPSRAVERGCTSGSAK